MKRNCLLSLIVAVFLAAAPVAGHAGPSTVPKEVIPSDGSVTTAKIADGAVTTNKIADGAVTDAKIAGLISGGKLGTHAHGSADLVDGSVSANDLAAGAVTSVKIADGSVSTLKVLDGAVTSTKLADGAVTGTKLANGSVADAKILGPISIGKLPVGTVAGTVAAGNHTHTSSAPPAYANVVVVAKSGGDFTDPVAALNSITNASATNPYLVRIMPGVYEIPVTSFNMKDYVDVEGSGPEVTVLSMHSNHMGHAISTVYFTNVSHAELRNLSIDHTGGSYVFGINVSGGDARVSNVDIRIQGGSWNGGLIVGYYNTSKARLTNVNIKVNGPQPASVLDQTTGIEIGGNSAMAGTVAILKNVKIEVANGYASYMSGLRVYPSAAAYGAGVQANQFLNTRWAGGTFKCVACYDNDFNLLP